MPRIIKEYYNSYLKEVENLSEKDDLTWNWRRDFIGVNGILNLMESTEKHPGKQYVYMNYGSFDQNGYLRTSCGEIDITGDQLTIVTKNSKYVFHLGTE